MIEKYAVNKEFHTDGSGFYTEVAKPVFIKEVEVQDLRDEHCGVLVNFFFVDWDTRKNGDIYTDKQFKREVRAYMQKNYQHVSNVDWSRLDYTEHSMQTDEYVSMEIGLQKKCTHRSQ